MIESQENPSENPADAEGRSESGVDPSGAASQETGSDSHTVAEQRALIAPMVPESQPPRPKVLVRVLSRVCEDRDEVDAVVEEIGAQSGRLAHIAIQALESNLSNGLQTQRESLDTQQESIRAQGAATRAQTARIDAQGSEIGSLAREVQAQGAEVRVNGLKTDALGERVDALGVTVVAQGKEISSLKTEVQTNGSKTDALGERVDALGETVAAQGKEIGSLRTEVPVNGSTSDAQVDPVITELRAFRRERRILLTAVGLLAIVRFGWLG